jgi:hypothetical protein
MKMSKPTILLFLLLSAALVVPSAAWSAPAALPPDGAKVAKDFLFAFARNDRDKISTMLPRTLENRYGPCPFVRLPALKEPRVDGSTGTILLEGGIAPGVAKAGMLTLRRVKVDGTKVWRVRQMYWYDELPAEAKKRRRSATSADRRQEPAVRAASEEFVRTWLAGNYEELDRQVFHWWDRDRDPPKWVKMTGVELRSAKESLGGLRVDFRATLKVLGTLPKRVDGTLWLVQEDGAWCVRPLSVAFWL